MKVKAIACPTCRTIIYSRARHDFHYCRCGEVAVDGGFDYMKICFKKKLPITSEFEVAATKQELFDDWNTDTNRFGWIYDLCPDEPTKTKKKTRRGITSADITQENFGS
jgi:Zn-finger nucleic acid-binding protein